MRRSWIGMGVVAGVAALALIAGQGVGQNADSSAQETRADRAVERTRTTVQMLDNIYKTAVVLITDKYVHTENDYPAGSAIIELFKQVGEKGLHQVRLIDLTGEPYDAENVANDDFEKSAAKEIQGGKAYVDRVETRDGQRYLRAMTAVPVVLQKCTMCHPHYEDVPEGAAIGAISYTLPVR